MPLDTYQLAYLTFLYITFVICTAFYIYYVICHGCELGNIKRDLQVMAITSSTQLLVTALSGTFESVIFNAVGGIVFFVFLYVATMMQVKFYTRLSPLSTWLKVKYVNLACKVLVFCVVGVNVCQLLALADRLVYSVAETEENVRWTAQLSLCDLRVTIPSCVDGDVWQEDD